MLDCALPLLAAGPSMADIGECGHRCMREVHKRHSGKLSRTERRWRDEQLDEVRHVASLLMRGVPPERLAALPWNRDMAAEWRPVVEAGR